MNKAEFLDTLQKKLFQLPEEEIEKSRNFYGEAIDDRVEDGMTEEEAVAAIGDINNVVEQILLDMPLPTLVKTRIKPDRALRTLDIVLLILGFPLWFPLVIAFSATALVIYLTIWIVILSLFLVVISLGAAGIISLLIGILRLSTGLASTLAAIGAGLFCIGLCTLSFFPAKTLTTALVSLTAKVARKIKSVFIKKEVTIDES